MRWLPLGLGAAALPAAAYGAWITAGGGLADMARQFKHAGSVDWTPFLTNYSGLESRRSLLAVLAATVLAFAILGAADRGRSSLLADLGPVGLLLGSVAVFLPIAVDPLTRYGHWGTTLQWILAAGILSELFIRRKVPGVGLWLLVIAYMTELSFGYSNPHLVGGSMAIYLFHRLWGAPLPILRLVNRTAPVLVAVVSLLALLDIYKVRTTDIYRELPAAQLTASAYSASSAFRFIKMDPVTAEYLRQVRACTNRYPAKKLAVTPYNVTTLLGFGHEPALPISLVRPGDYAGSEGQLRDAVDRLDRAGDYLVLLQTWPGDPRFQPELPKAVVGGDVYSDNGGGYYLDLIARLTGSRHACGSFVAIYKPAG